MMTSRRDPIFAAIEKYRRAHEKLSAAIKATDAYQSLHRETFHSPDRRLRELEKRQGSLCDANWHTIQELCATKPTTLAGVIAALRFAEESKAAGDEFLHCISARETDDTSYPVFLSTLRKALEYLGT